MEKVTELNICSFMDGIIYRNLQIKMIEYAKSNYHINIMRYRSYGCYGAECVRQHQNTR